MALPNTRLKINVVHRLTFTKICDCRHVREFQISTGLPYQHSSATASLVQPKRAAIGIGMSRNGAAEHKTQNQRQLHHDAKRRPKAILPWVVQPPYVTQIADLALDKIMRLQTRACTSHQHGTTVSPC